MRVELHCHTKFSHDSCMNFHFLYWKCILLKIKYIAVTEHNNIKGALKFAEFCEKRGNKVNVIIGEEIMTTEGEIIGLYLKEEIPAGISANEAINRIINQNAIVYVPHPYDEKRCKTVLKESVISENSYRIDCIECHNGRNISERYSDKQEEIANRYKLVKVVGSDAHTIIEIGRNYMEFKIPPTDGERFKNAVRTAELHKSSCILLAHTITKFVRIFKMLGKGKINEIFRIVNKRRKHKMQKMGK